MKWKHQILLFNQQNYKEHTQILCELKFHHHCLHIKEDEIQHLITTTLVKNCTMTNLHTDSLLPEKDMNSVYVTAEEPDRMCNF